MKKIFTILTTLLVALGTFAATEPAWYNDVTSISNNGKYYIYSVNGKGFMQAGQTTVKSVNANTSTSDLLFTIAKQEQGTVSCNNKYLFSYQAGSTCGPVHGNGTDKGTNIIWTLLENGTFWNIHALYDFMGNRYAALFYKNDQYDAVVKDKNPISQNRKDTYTDVEYQWYVISQAHYARHWAIYSYDAYKENISDYTKYKGSVPAAYYSKLQADYNTTFNVKNTAHSKEVVNAHQAELKSLYDNANTIAQAYAAAKATIKNLEDIEDKGDGDLAKINNDITAAHAAIENALTVDALNAAVSAPALKGIDPVTINTTTFTALESIGTPASSVQGRAISYDAQDKKIINAEGIALYKGTTTLTATAAETEAYYAFVRTATVTVNAINNESNYNVTICDGGFVTYQEETFTATTSKDFTLVNRTGGDSIIHFSLTVNQLSATAETKTIVVGAEETWNGYALSEKTVGQHELTYTTTNAAGCDSVVTLTLTVNKQETLQVPVNFEFCAGESETFRGVEYAEAGSFNVQATGDIRDTLYVVNVTVNQPSTSAETKNIIYGDNETWNGNDLSVKTVGQHDLIYTTTNAAGCDSVVTLTLTVNKQETLQVPVNFEFCAGESETFRGVEYAEAGSFNVPATGDIRDTLYVVNVTVNEPSSTAETQSIIVGAEATWNGYDLSEMSVGNFELTYTTTNAAGCDSIVTLKLIVEKLDILEATQELSFCTGDSAEYRGKWYFEAGTDLVNTQGATRDTLIAITITVFETTYEERFDTVKVGDIIELGNIEWTLSEEIVTGSYEVKEEDLGEHIFEYVGQTENGCDAIIKLFVLVEPKDEDAIDHVTMDNAQTTMKYLRDGQLYILHGNKTYNAAGQLVR